MSRADRRVYSIPAGTGFLDALAEGVLAETAGDPLALSGYRILLPTRRACRGLQEAFLRKSGGAPLLLPNQPAGVVAATVARALPNRRSDDADFRSGSLEPPQFFASGSP